MSKNKSAKICLAAEAALRSDLRAHYPLSFLTKNNYFLNFGFGQNQGSKVNLAVDAFAGEAGSSRQISTDLFQYRGVGRLRFLGVSA